MSGRRNPLSRHWWRLVRFGFRLLYNEMAFTYDTVSKVVSLGAWRCWQRAALVHLDVAKTEPVLELAHGTGDLQLDLHTGGYRPFGYDLSVQMGRIARQKLTRHDYPPRLARGMTQALPFASQSFGAVVSTFPTDFIFAPETLQEVARVLRPDGQFIVVPTGMFTTSGVTEAGLEWLYRVTGQRQGDLPDVGSLFAGYGFSIALYQETCPRSIAQVIVLRKTH